jgi:iron complex outermembrane recepter protein
VRAVFGVSCGVLVLAAVGALPGLAGSVEEVLVTGLRPAYQGDVPFMRTPRVDQRIDQQVLQNAGATDLSQALDLSASVARQNNFGGLWNSFAVRGFAGDENLPSNYLVNGFNAGRGFGGPRDLSGIEAVEVLKGPRAALFGRGEPGGTVNLVSKRPSFDPSGQWQVSAGSFDSYRTDVDINRPLGDALALRAPLFYEASESFREPLSSERYGLSPSLLWQLSARSQLVYELEYSQQAVPFDRGVVAPNGQLGLVPRERFLGEPGDGDIEAEAQGHQLEWQHDLSDDWRALLGYNQRETSLEGFSTEAELARNRQKLFSDGQTLSRQRRFRDYDARYQVLRGELAGQVQWLGLSHQLLVGVDRDKFTNDQVFLRVRPPAQSGNPSEQQQLAINIFNPEYGRFPLPTPGPQSNNLETQESTGVFLQDQITLAPRWDLRLGLRHDDFDQRLQNRANGRVSEQSDTRLSPQAGLVFAATPQWSWYAAYGENFRPLTGSDAAGNTFAPNQSQSVETGLKFEGEGLTGTASVFRIEQDNILVADGQNPGFSRAAGQAQSQGLELDVTGELAEGLSLWASYAYVDAQMSEPALDVNFSANIEAGDRLINVPEHSLSLLLTRNTQWAGRGLTYGGGLLYVGSRLGEVATDFYLPSYSLLRLLASYELSRDLSLRAEVNNLLDETYYSNSYSQLWVQPGTPRQFKVSAQWRF